MDAERVKDERRAQAIEHLLRISSGEIDYDFDAAQRIHAERESGRKREAPAAAPQ